MRNARSTSRRGPRLAGRLALLLAPAALLALTACASRVRVSARVPAQVTVSTPAPAPAGHCYWMENQSGAYRWVSASRFGVVTRDQCYAADSCSGGLGRSGGGCYKWADCPECEAHPW